MAARLSDKRSRDRPDLEAIRNGDRAAFEVLVWQESPRLFRIIVRIVKDEDEARSVMQETFLQAYRRLGAFRGNSKRTTWIYNIGINLACASLRKRRRHDLLEEVDIERLQPSFHKGRYGQRVEPWDAAEELDRAERMRLMRQAIDWLPVKYRVVVTLRDLEEFGTDEVAEILGITVVNVRVRLHRARRALRKMLEPYMTLI